MKKELFIPPKDNYKVVAISDIHGHDQIFDSLLDQLNLEDDDHLIIIGDFINKGPNSLKTLRRMMELSSRPHTTILKGNHEYFICKYLFSGETDINYFTNDKFLEFIINWPFESILKDFCKDQGMTIDTFTDFESLRTMIFDHYEKEAHFINNLPILAHLDDMVFVHGGYDASYDVDLDEGKFLKFDDFNHLSGVQEKTVIVGHWPTSNLRINRNSNQPLFNDEKKIISIDGGLGVKTSGELNALIIEKEKGKKHIHYIQENSFTKKTIKETHVFDIEDKIFVNYPHFDLELIEKGPLMTKCRHVHTGKVLTIFNSLLDFTGDQPKVMTTYINHFLNLEPGTVVELVMTYDDCALVKYGNEFGWILTRQLD